MSREERRKRRTARRALRRTQPVDRLIGFGDADVEWRWTSCSIQPASLNRPASLIMRRNWTGDRLLPQRFPGRWMAEEFARFSDAGHTQVA